MRDRFAHFRCTKRKSCHQTRPFSSREQYHSPDILLFPQTLGARATFPYYYYPTILTALPTGVGTLQVCIESGGDGDTPTITRDSTKNRIQPYVRRTSSICRFV